ncbi:sigma-70 family RNA polymerase sigma factor [Demequina salsinemoris]|uniref:sigma-70 family RNA polymerase sigma factor n=1 Tax=Demequina salsinemoris TaxID=577470 RepID=UPI000783257C|nr:sigma-70 family RNA polymerase sigma factor [Demequina salsinemoris]
MSHEAIALWTDASSDPELIAGVRAGDAGAFGVLYERHVDAARKVAAQYTNAPSDIDDVVSESFSRVLRALQRGDGPDLAFRAYLFTIVRRTGMDIINRGIRTRPRDDMSEYESTMGYEASSEEPTMEGFEQGLVAAAFRSLPERWQAVLWYTEVEKKSPKEIAPLLGLSANGVAALSYRAREALRQAYLQQHLTSADQVDCLEANAQLGAYVRGGLSKRESTRVDSHVQACERCQALILELEDVNRGMRGIIAPLVMGVLGVGALEGGLPIGGALAAGAGAAAGSGAASGAGASSAGGAGSTAVGAGATTGASTATAVSGVAAGAAGVAGAVGTTGAAGAAATAGTVASFLGGAASLALPVAATIGVVALAATGASYLGLIGPDDSPAANDAAVVETTDAGDGTASDSSAGAAADDGSADDSDAADDADTAVDEADQSDGTNTGTTGSTGTGTGTGSGSGSGSGSDATTDDAVDAGIVVPGAAPLTGAGLVETKSTPTGTSGGTSTGGGTGTSGGSTDTGSSTGAGTSSDDSDDSGSSSSGDTSGDDGTDTGDDGTDSGDGDGTTPASVLAASLSIRQAPLDFLGISSTAPAIAMTLANGGDGSADDVTAEITLPDGLTFSTPDAGVGAFFASVPSRLDDYMAFAEDGTFTAGAWDCTLTDDRSGASCSLDALEPGASTTLDLDVTITGTLAADATTRFRVAAGENVHEYSVRTGLSGASSDLTPVFATSGTVAATQVGAPLLECPASASHCTTAMQFNGNATNSWLNNEYYAMRPSEGIPGLTGSNVTTLDIPDDATVAYASLEWAASASYGSGEFSGDTAAAQLLLPGAADAVDITADSVETSDDGSGHTVYQARIDVTDLVAAAGSGEYGLGGIALADSYDDSGDVRDYFAGFALTVVYEDASLPEASVAVYAGQQWLSGHDSSSFDLFAARRSDVTIGVVGFGGDRGRVGDRIDVDGDTLAPLHWKNGTVSTGDSGNAMDSTAFGYALPNTLGVDAKPFRAKTVDSGLHTLTARTDEDSYLLSTVTITAVRG